MQAFNISKLTISLYLFKKKVHIFPVIVVKIIMPYHILRKLSNRSRTYDLIKSLKKYHLIQLNFEIRTVLSSSLFNDPFWIHFDHNLTKI